MQRVLALLVLLIISTPCGAFSAADTVRKIDEFGNLSCKDEGPRLDNIAIALRNEPAGIGYVYAYGGRQGRRGEARARLTRIKDYLIKRRGLSESRLRFADGGYREELQVEFYIIPAGVSPPSVSPTVDPEEVKFKPGRIKKWELRCGGRG